LTETTNGAGAYDHTGSKLVDLFFNIGSARNNQDGIVQTFLAAFGHNKLLAMKCLFWARDVRGGAGERQTFRHLMQVLENIDLTSVLKNMKLVPEFGRYDDLLVFKAPQARAAALKVFADAISVGNGLACKWAPRKGPDAVALTKQLGLSPKQYRKLIVQGSNTVEQKLCAKEFDQIEYSKLPSIAAARYQQTFNRHDLARYNEYKEMLKTGAATINATAIFPHTVIRSAESGDAAVADAQWKALPNYVGDCKVLPVSDVSGSMECKAGGNTTCMDVSIALGLYLAEKNTGPFKDLICTFHSTPEFVKPEGDLLTKVTQLRYAPWGGSTNIQKTFELILNTAINGKCLQEDMPEYIVILSDMQFNDSDRRFGPTTMDMIRGMYAAARYKCPTLVFWNLNGSYGNQPSTATENGVVMVSGFSPAIMKAVLAADFSSITPESMMLSVLNSERYEGVTV
jgi:hypothetical protein